MMRSLMFVPADSEKKLSKARTSGADALAIDLEDSVLPPRKDAARGLMRDWFAAQPDRQGLWVRVNDLASGHLLKDLAAVAPCRPAGILLPKIRGPEDVLAVGHYLEALEVAQGLDPGHIRIMVVVTETPIAVLRLGELAQQAHPRISHVTWGAEDLSSAMGAADPRNEAGAWRPTYEHARSQCLLVGHALGAEVLDTLYVDFKDPESLRRACAASRHDGFTGRIAIHPDQVRIINESFSPSEAELQQARRIVEAFEHGAGAVSLDGKMYDVPHLKAARRLLSSTNAHN